MVLGPCLLHQGLLNTDRGVSRYRSPRRGTELLYDRNYRPSLREIAVAINENYGYPTVHDLDKSAAPSQQQTRPASNAETS
jgi:hypothetical protein